MPGFSALQRAENSSIDRRPSGRRRCVGFSALQRAENSSIDVRHNSQRRRIEFQCSSASRKFLNSVGTVEYGIRKRVSVLFSEPKIPQSKVLVALVEATYMFQCSSASRKFLNLYRQRRRRRTVSRFQCSSASRKFLNEECLSVSHQVEFQCSSASRKFLNSTAVKSRSSEWSVSVLFSEPKIPQSARRAS